MKIGFKRLPARYSVAVVAVVAVLPLAALAWLLGTVRADPIALGPVFCTTLTNWSVPSGGGTFWVSLPATSSIASAEELFTLIPNADTVQKLFPASTPYVLHSQSGGGCTSQEPGTSACQTSSNPNPCFCVRPGEGFQVTVTAASAFQLMGIDSSTTIPLAGGGAVSLISLPFNTPIVNAKSLMDDIGSTNVQEVRKYITASDVMQIYTGRKGESTGNFPIQPGVGYGVKMLNAVNYVPSRFGPIAAASCASQDSDFGVTGIANTPDFPWQLQNAGSGVVCGELAAPLTALGDAATIAKDFTLSISGNTTCFNATAVATHVTGATNFKVTYTGPTGPPTLLVGPQGGTANCNVNASTSGCTFNPTVSLIVLPPPDPQRVGVNKSAPDTLLSWNDPGDPALTWNVYRSTQPNTGLWGAPIATGVSDIDPASPGFQFLDAGALTSSDSYYYKVTAVNVTGESPLGM